VNAPAEVDVFVTQGESDDVLLIHRSPEDGAYWHVVAGVVEACESVADAAARELLEEVGLSAEPRDSVEVVAWADADTLEPVADPSTVGQMIGVSVSCYRVAAPSGWTPQLNSEHDDYRWCAADDAAAMLRWPQTAAALRLLLRSR
jgi:8-oxo-dGTP pyrophosphatase MutT (NUDIX family)